MQTANLQKEKVDGFLDLRFVCKGLYNLKIVRSFGFTASMAIKDLIIFIV
jgi:hypothetical protein